MALQIVQQLQYHLEVHLSLLRWIFYEDYWDLTTGTTFDGYVSNNPCLRQQQYGASSNIYFTHNNDEQPPYPTSKGWFSLRDDVYVFASGVDFSNSHQMSIEFEIFPVDTYYNMEVYPYEDANPSTRMHIDFTFFGTYSYRPYSSTKGLKLAVRQWNKVFISVTIMDVSNSIKVAVYAEPLLSSSASSVSPNTFLINGVTSDMLSASKLNLSIKNAHVSFNQDLSKI